MTFAQLLHGMVFHLYRVVALIKHRQLIFNSSTIFFPASHKTAPGARCVFAGRPSLFCLAQLRRYLPKQPCGARGTTSSCSARLSLPGTLRCAQGTQEEDAKLLLIYVTLQSPKDIKGLYELHV